jgi:hypothetical protein
MSAIRAYAAFDGDSCASLSGLRPLADRMSALRDLDAVQAQTKLVIEGDDLWQAVRKRSRFA